MLPPPSRRPKGSPQGSEQGHDHRTPDPRQAAAAGISGRPAKRSFTIGGHRTSISLEAAFWDALKAAADAESVPISRLIAEIDAARAGCGLSSAIRVWLLARYRQGSP